MILVVAPEGATRTAALLSGTVDLIETPTPDTVDRLTKAGMKIVQNVTPHVWNYHPSMLPGSPWTDIRLRKAANLAIDRDAIVQLLGGLATPAFGQVDKSSPWFGKPSFQIKFAPDDARTPTPSPRSAPRPRPPPSNSRKSRCRNQTPAASAKPRARGNARSPHPA